MTKDKVTALIREVGIIPAVRVSSDADARFAAEAVMRAGIPIVEITMTVPGALEVIAHLVAADPSVAVGAGTVLDCHVARQCLDAGACFITSPSFLPDVVSFTAKEKVTVLPGALTPTEVVGAFSAGADFVKVFPCEPIGGEKYIQSLSVALPQIPLIAAGGVNHATAGDYILAGALAIGVGRELIPPEAIERRQSGRIHELASRFTKIVRDAREQIEAWKQSAAVRK